MSNMLDHIDNQDNEQSIETITQISDFWKIEDLKQGLGST